LSDGCFIDAKAAGQTGYAPATAATFAADNRDIGGRKLRAIVLVADWLPAVPYRVVQIVRASAPTEVLKTVIVGDVIPMEAL
jgi:hypothetical protein